MSRAVTNPKLLLAAGAAAVASIAYAVGTHADSTAGAATGVPRFQTISATGATGATGAGATGATGPSGRFRGPHGPGAFRGALADAATALGVSEAKLEAALRTLRPAAGQRPDGRGELATALAASTGVDVAKVRTALAAQRPARAAGAMQRGARFDALAKELGLSAAKVQAAFKAALPQRGARGNRAAFLTALAKELGVSEDKLTQALGTVGPGPGFGGRRGGFRGQGAGGPWHGGVGARRLDTAALAKALGVDEAKVTAGITAFTATREKEQTARRATLIAQLAKELGVPEAKVEAVAERFLPTRGQQPTP